MSARRGRGRIRSGAPLGLFLIVGLLAIASVPVTVVAPPASAYWSAAASATSAGASRAASVNAGSTPAAAVANRNQVSVTWPATTLSNGTAVTGYTLTRYSAANEPAPPLPGCAGVIASTSCVETGVPDGRWTYRVTPRVANWAGAAGAASNEVLTDATPPVNNINLVPTVNVIKNGNTVWVRTAAGAGSFVLRNALTDAGSGPASSATGSLVVVSGSGFNHTPSTVSTPVGGPYQSAPFSWITNASGSVRVGVTGSDQYANTATTTITVAADNTAPTGGAISYPDIVTTQTVQQVTVAAIADSQSGLGAASRYLQASTAPLTGTTCGTFSGYANFLANPATAPSTQPVTLQSGTCYRFVYFFTDSVGNSTTTTPAGMPVIKVRPAAPANPAAAASSGSLVQDAPLGARTLQSAPAHAPVLEGRPSLAAIDADPAS